MPQYDAVATVTEQEIDLPTATVEGLYYQKANRLVGGSLGALISEFYTSSLSQAFNNFSADGETIRWTAFRTNSLSPGGSQIGPLVFEDVVFPSTAPPPDTTPPVVAFVFPVDSSTVQGTFTWQVSVTDDSPVPTQQLRVDGVLVDQTLPYDSAPLSNARHIAEFTATDANANTTVVSIPFYVNNPSPAPAPARLKVIFIGSDKLGRMRTALWAEVPASMQSVFASPGTVSAWPLASGSENTDIENGVVAETVILLTQTGKTDVELEAEAQARWVQYNDAIQALDAFSSRNNLAWDGSLWAVES